MTHPAMPIHPTRLLITPFYGKNHGILTKHNIETKQAMSDMQQLEFFAIPSPCIGICQSGSRGYCKGCFRSREERLHWLQIDDQTKRIIVKACNRRKQIWLRKQAEAKPPQTPSEQQDLF